MIKFFFQDPSKESNCVTKYKIVSTNPVGNIALRVRVFEVYPVMVNYHVYCTSLPLHVIVTSVKYSVCQGPVIILSCLFNYCLVYRLALLKVYIYHVKHKKCNSV